MVELKSLLLEHAKRGLGYAIHTRDLAEEVVCVWRVFVDPEKWRIDACRACDTTIEVGVSLSWEDAERDVAKALETAMAWFDQGDNEVR